MKSNGRGYCGDCFFKDNSELRFDKFTINDSGSIVANVSGNCFYGPYKGEIRMNNQEGIYRGEGKVTYSRVSQNSFSLLITEQAVRITELHCYIDDGIWREDGKEYHFEGELERIFHD